MRLIDHQSPKLFATASIASQAVAKLVLNSLGGFLISRLPDLRLRRGKSVKKGQDV
jgi:hypothetical protein